MDENEAKRARQQSGLQTTALAVLLGRSGGTLTYTEAEYRELADRYGGKASMGIHIDLAKPTDGGDATVTVTLIRKDPSQGSLVS